MVEYVVSVGMEVHAELSTRSKMFCSCPVAFGGEPNTRVCPVCLGLPGALPVPNRHAVELVLRTALALNCTIAWESVFHRKNYFYPDLPKGYQISQYGETNPIGYRGRLEITCGDGYKEVRIRRVHLEEDTGKLMHLPGGGSGVDYNRAGVPLMEIVTDFPPDIESAEEAKEYLVQLRALLVYLGVCDGKMEEGSLRCEPNISVRPRGSAEFGTKTELKNLNSFRSVHLGVEHETVRQVGLLERGEVVRHETRGWNENTESSFSMRVKEYEHDYRYFPDPDLVPMRLDDEIVSRVRGTLVELPLDKSRRFQERFGLGAYDAGLLVSSRAWADFFEAAVAEGADAKLVCNWMNSDFAKFLNETGQVVPGAEPGPAGVTLVTASHLAELVWLVEGGTITGRAAKDVFAEVARTGARPAEVVAATGVTAIGDETVLQEMVEQVLAAHPSVVEKYKSGRDGVLGFLVGQVMKSSQGRADPNKVQALLRAAMEES